MRYCPRCGAKNTSGDPVCRRCGQKLYGVMAGHERVDFQACGTANPSDASFCLGCGRRAGAQIARPTPVEARPVEAVAGAGAPPSPGEPRGQLATEADLE